MALLNNITSTLSSFKDICGRMGLSKPTVDLRQEMKALIAAGKVVQEGQRRGAKYRLADGVTAEDLEAASEAPQKAPEKAEAPEAPAPPKTLSMTSAATPKPVVEWDWEDPSEYTWTSHPQEEGELHRWLLENWETLAEKPSDIVRLGIRISEHPDCSARPLTVCNAICDLAQSGKIKVKHQVGTSGYQTEHLYGPWR